MARLTEAMREAAKAHTRLNTFYAVISVLETMPSGCARANQASEAIIKRCKAAAQIQLDKYDRAIDAGRAALQEENPRHD